MSEDISKRHVTALLAIQVAIGLAALAFLLLVPGCPRERAQVTLIENAGKVISRLHDEHSRAYSRAAAAVRATLPDAGQAERLAAYDAAMVRTDALHRLRGEAIAVAADELRAYAAGLDAGDAGGYDPGRVAQALSIVLRALASEAPGLLPIPPPPGPLLVLLNRLARTDGGAP